MVTVVTRLIEAGQQGWWVAWWDWITDGNFFWTVLTLARELIGWLMKRKSFLKKARFGDRGSI